MSSYKKRRSYITFCVFFFINVLFMRKKTPREEILLVDFMKQYYWLLGILLAPFPHI